MPSQHLSTSVRRVALIASAGGHWIELLRLASAVEDCDCLFISTSSDLTPPFGDRPIVQIMDGSRDTPCRLIKSAFDLHRALREFRPDIIITTGAAPGAVAMMIGKWLGSVTIWTDSIANSENLSLSGRFVKIFADLRLTQWEHLANQTNNIHYIGRVL